MKVSYFSIVMMSVFVMSLAFMTGAFAQNESTFKYDPTLQYGSKPQTPAETPGQLHEKLVNAKDAISNIMGSKMGDIPFNEVSVDEVNSILDVGIDSSKATLSEEQYLKMIKEIVGDIPIKITFEQINSLPLILTNNSVPDNNTSASNGMMKSNGGPVVITLESPLKQFKSGTDPYFVICNQNLQLVIKSSDNSPACVKPSSIERLLKQGWVNAYDNNGKYLPILLPNMIKVQNTNFTINYDITGNNKLLDAHSDVNSKTLILSLKTMSNGTLTIVLPRTLIDSRITEQQDDKFFVLMDGQETDYTEIKTTNATRTLNIHFMQGIAKIEIIGTNAI